MTPDMKKKSLRELREDNKRLSLLAENWILDSTLNANFGYAGAGEAGSVYDLGYRGEVPLMQPMTGADVSTREVSTGFTTLAEHDRHRRLCRWLYNENPFARNAIENLVSYIVGTGMEYTVAPIDPDLAGDRDIALRVKSDIDDFIESEAWGTWEQEFVRRVERDGELFLQVFPDAESEMGWPAFRVREPSELSTPNAGALMGIFYQPGDAMVVTGYSIGGEQVETDNILHLKANVDANVPRGVSSLWTPRTSLINAAKSLRAMTVTTQIQSSIPMIRKHGDTSKDALSKIVGAQANGRITNPTTNKVENVQAFRPGQAIDTTGNVEITFPIAGVNVPGMVEAVQAELRAAASAMVLPEWMLTARLDAKYANAEISEGPTGAMFGRKQAFYGRAFRRFIERNVLPELGWKPDELVRVRIKCLPPGSSESLSLEEAQVGQILLQNGVMSRETLANRAGLDASVEQSRIRREEDETLGVTNQTPGNGVAQ